MTSLSTSGWRAGLILSRLSESKTDSASHVVPSNSCRHEGGTPESTEERKLTLLKVSFLSVSSSGVPPEVTAPPTPLGFFSFGVSRKCGGGKIDGDNVRSAHA